MVSAPASPRQTACFLPLACWNGKLFFKKPLSGTDERSPLCLTILSSASFIQADSALPFVDSLFSPTPYPVRLRTRSSHNPRRFHNRFGDPSGSRGKPYPLSPCNNQDFQNPSIAQPRFRKLARTSTSSLQSPSATFPLFLPHLRVLLSFFFIFLIFSSSSVAAYRATRKIRCTGTFPAFSACSAPQSAILQGIQRCTPVFHAQGRVKVNTIKKKKPKAFPRGCKLLYSVASADFAFVGFSSGAAKRGWVHVQGGN